MSKMLQNSVFMMLVGALLVVLFARECSRQKASSYGASARPSLPSIDEPATPLFERPHPKSKMLADESRVQVPLRGSTSESDVADGGVTDEVDPSISVVLEWNAAHNKHDAASLRRMYAPEVDFYGQNLTLDKVMTVKASLLARAPDFSQQVSDFDVTHPTDDSARVAFRKRWVSDGKPGEIACILEIRRFDRLVIAKETDASVNFR
jgi:hypothetical protein